jgi:uncharacterized membrane protein YozB (DUF420 family)
LIETLPHLNALLNATSAVCLVSGYVAIRRGRRELHAKFMLSALAAALLFLVSYVIYHYAHGATKYPRHDWTRPLYFAILISHTVLAVVNVPLVAMTVTRAVRKQFDAHRRIAKWTLRVWLYVSVTGILVYLMLYRL